MRRKILLIDDDATLLRFLGDYLDDEGMEVITALGGVEGLRLAYKEQPALVVMDVMMPGMDGWETATRLRELSDVPIIFLTAKTAEEDKLRGFQIGVDDYITKPFSFAELTARVQAVLNRSRAAPAEEPNRVLVGDLVLDLDARELRRAGQPVALTPTEYRLLETLARRRGRAVEEAVLVQEVWGENGLEDRAAVRRYIFLLRQKVEADPSNPRYILTVRGYGYRLGE